MPQIFLPTCALTEHVVQKSYTAVNIASF